MKKFVYLLLGFLTAGAVSCTEDTTRFVEPDSACKVTGEALNFEAEGGTQSFSIEAYNLAWRIGHEPSRGTWYYAEGDAGENFARIEYTLPANDSEEPYEDYFQIEIPGFEPVKVSVAQKGVVYTPVLEVYPVELYFSAKGGSRAVYVTAEHVEWDITTEDEWLTIERTEETDDAGRIKVNITAEAWNDTVNDRWGEITVSGEGVESKTITVGQLAAEIEQEPENIWERSSRSRMNLKGNVQTVSEQFNFMTSSAIQNLSFDAAGMLLAYTRMNMYENVENHSITYDADGRITKIEGRWNANDSFQLTFTYGSHGKYVSVWELFTKLQESSIDLQHTVWLPRVILDLERIDLTFHRDESGMYSETDGTGVIAWTITGDTGTLSASLDYTWGPSTFEQTLAFSGAYPTQVKTSDGTIVDYSFNPANGYLIYTAEYFDGSQPEGKTWYNDDRINSVQKNDASDEWTGFTTAYDEELDILEQKYATEYMGFTVVYPEKDMQGNWLKAEFSDPWSTTPHERTITYF